MPTDGLNARLIHKESKSSSFVRFVKGMTKAGKKSKDIYSKSKSYAFATQSKGERAFATFAQGCDYMDKAAWLFPVAKVFTAPIATASKQINNVIQLRAFLRECEKMEIIPLTLEYDLIEARTRLEEECTLANADDSSYDPDDEPLIRGIDGLLAFLRQRYE
jgi:hypothetical protein